MEKRILMSTILNAMPLVKERLDRDWIEYRLDIYMNYTLQCLKQQTNQNFCALVNYDNSSEDIIKEALSKYEKLPDNVVFVKDKEYEKQIKNHVEDSPNFLLVRLDSDNLYHKSHIQQLHDYQHGKYTIVLLNQAGYIWDVVNKKMACWYHFSPPFYTLIYNTRDYLKGLRYKLPGGHRGAVNLCHEILPPGKFLVLIHKSNIMSGFNSSMRKEMIEDPLQIQNILTQFIGEKSCISLLN